MNLANKWFKYVKLLYYEIFFILEIQKNAGIFEKKSLFINKYEATTNQWECSAQYALPHGQQFPNKLALSKTHEYILPHHPCSPSENLDILNITTV